MACIQPVTRIPGVELGDWVQKADFAILPLGAVEWHGPHLPLGTDLILCEGFARAAAEAGEFTAVLYPPVPYAACPGKTRGYPGTVAVRPETALAYLIDVLEGILATGFVRVLLLNAHDGHMSMARAAMEWVSGRHRCSLLLVNWWQLVTPEETAAQGFFAGHSGRGHGGPYEGAVTWAFAPEAVRPGAAREIVPRPALATDRPYVLVESCPSPWEGYAGLIGQMDREKGEWIVRQATGHLGRLIRAWLAAPLPDPPPGAGPHLSAGR
ncbi:MAG: creatininase family protein [Firmicutes bacterium]|nr:creatininase family protein [Bacillota bacterium]